MPLSPRTQRDGLDEPSRAPTPPTQRLEGEPSECASGGGGGGGGRRISGEVQRGAAPPGPGNVGGGYETDNIWDRAKLELLESAARIMGTVGPDVAEAAVRTSEVAHALSADELEDLLRTLRVRSATGGVKASRVKRPVHQRASGPGAGAGDGDGAPDAASDATHATAPLAPPPKRTATQSGKHREAAAPDSSRTPLDEFAVDPAAEDALGRARARARASASSAAGSTANSSRGVREESARPLRASPDCVAVPVERRERRGRGVSASDAASGAPSPELAPRPRQAPTRAGARDT